MGVSTGASTEAPNSDVLHGICEIGGAVEAHTGAASGRRLPRRLQRIVVVVVVVVVIVVLVRVVVVVVRLIAVAVVVVIIIVIVIVVVSKTDFGAGPGLKF